MSYYTLQVSSFEQESSPELLYGTVYLKEDVAFKILQSDLLEAGLIEYPDEVDAWFNDNAEEDNQSSARDFYNSTISDLDIEVNVDFTFTATVGQDTFAAHVEDTWDELAGNEDARALSESNIKLGRDLLARYADPNEKEDFKLWFEWKSGYKWEYGYDPEKLRKTPADKLDEFEQEAKNSLLADLEDIIEDNRINWTLALKEYQKDNE